MLDRRRTIEPFKLRQIYQVNVLGTLHLLSGINTTHTRAVVVVGSCEEYGDGDVPYEETQLAHPISPYGASKLAATHLCQMLYRTTSLPVVVVRPSVAYGPGQGSKGFIGAAIKACLSDTSMPMTGGEQTRDFIYIDDLVEGIIRASSEPKALGEIINLGYGMEYKLKDVAQLIMELTGSKDTLKVGELPYRSREVMRYCCTNQKAKRLLNWEPEVSLETGLLKTIEAAATEKPHLFLGKTRRVN